MRASLWLILILAFSLGMSCALAVRYLHFEAKTVVKRNTAEPTTKILIAKHEIPSGVDITAEFLYFQEVSLSEVPLGALTSFNQAFRRQPAYPTIPEGCPICEDLLLPQSESTANAAFLPAGSQFVTLDVVNVRQGNQVFSPKHSLSTVISADQCVDIRVVPREETLGKLAEKKNAVLRNFASPDLRSRGNLLLENVPIHRFQKQTGAGITGASKESLVLALNKNDAEKLATATKKGQIQIVAHQNGKTVPKPLEPENGSDSASADNVPDTTEVPSPTLRVSLPPEQPLPQNMAFVQEGTASLQAEVISMDKRTAPVPVVDPFGVSLTSPVQETTSSAASGMSTTLPSLDAQSLSPNSPSTLTMEAEEKIPIRNDAPVISFGGDNDLRKSPAESPAESSKMATQTPSPDEPGFDALNRPFAETALGPPRISQSIQFIFPGNASITPARDYPQESKSRAAATPSAQPPVLPSAQSAAVSALSAPMVLPVPSAISLGKTGVPSYTPFERRIYTVLPESPASDGSLELLPPPQIR